MPFSFPFFFFWSYALVDFIAISFVKSAEVINHLKSYIAARARDG